MPKDQKERKTRKDVANHPGGLTSRVPRLVLVVPSHEERRVARHLGVLGDESSQRGVGFEIALIRQQRWVEPQDLLQSWRVWPGGGGALGFRGRTARRLPMTPTLVAFVASNAGASHATGPARPPSVRAHTEAEKKRVYQSITQPLGEVNRSGGWFRICSRDFSEVDLSC